MPTSSMPELLVEQLRDLYDAEKQSTKALPKLAKAASDEELAQCFRDHLEQTKEQVGRLEQIFEKLGLKAKSKPCEAMKGLVQEGQEAIAEDLEDPFHDVALIAAGRRVEHYEIAAYDTLVIVSQSLKNPEVVSLLQETLKEETDTDKKLAAIGKRMVKEAAKPQPAASKKSAPPPAAPKAAKKTAQKKIAKNAKSNGASGNLSHTTTDHEEIRNWAEERGGKPACVRGTGGKNDIGLMRIEFPGKPNANDSKLEEISWDEFFEKFDERGLALVYQEHLAGGGSSNFNKLVTREMDAPKKGRTAR